MNILMVLSAKKYPPDRRVEREAHALAASGHKVFLMARRGPDQPKEEMVDGVHVIRVPLPFQGKKAISDTIYFYFQRYWIYCAIVRACRRHGIEALHVHDLPYAFATTLAGQRMKIPIVFDMHEHYVQMMRDSFEARQYKKYKPFSAPLLWAMMLEEKYACKHVSRVIVVVKEHGERIVPLGVPAEHIVEICNTEDVEYFRSIPFENPILERYQQSDDFMILYVGGFSMHRGLETAIEAVPKVLEAIPNARLVLVGDGENRQELEELVEKLNLKEHVLFPGFVPFAQIPTYIHLCKVALIPYIYTPETESGVPNKLFQYMILSRPIIVSNLRPHMRIVRDAQCGLVFTERNAEELAERIIELKDEEKRKTLGQNGQKAAEEKYNWQNTVQDLLKMYDELAEKTKKG